MSHVIKAKAERLGGHYHVAFFGGIADTTLGGLGKLVMDERDWDEFKRVLVAGGVVVEDEHDVTICRHPNMQLRLVDGRDWFVCPDCNERNSLAFMLWLNVAGNVRPDERSVELRELIHAARAVHDSDGRRGIPALCAALAMFDAAHPHGATEGRL